MRAGRILAMIAAWFAVSVAVAHEQGEIIVRTGFANVSPDASSSALELNGGAIAGSEADVDDNSQLGLTFTYMLSDDWGLNVLASTPFKHDIEADTGALGLGTVDAGETKHLPPTFTLLYFPMDSQNAVQPYFGAGLNYTAFFSEDVDSELEGVLGSGSLSLDDSFGFAAQLGVDYHLSERLLLNASVYWLDIKTDATFEFVGNNRIDADVDIDPFVYLVTLGWVF